MRLPVDEAPLTISRDGLELARFDLEIAQTPEQRANGLMNRRDLPRDRAMLFVFDEMGMRFFWMENTPTPLDIIYADNSGKIVHIARDTTPFSRAPIPSNEPARYALEIHSGQSESFGIRIGDKLDHPIIPTE